MDMHECQRQQPFLTHACPAIYGNVDDKRESIARVTRVVQSVPESDSGYNHYFSSISIVLFCLTITVFKKLVLKIY